MAKCLVEWSLMSHIQICEQRTIYKYALLTSECLEIGVIYWEVHHSPLGFDSVSGNQYWDKVIPFPRLVDDLHLCEHIPIHLIHFNQSILVQPIIISSIQPVFCS